MTIGDRIREARKNAKLSQTELGIKLDIGKSSVSEWESGKRPVPIDVVEEIASVLDVTVPYLMGWNIESTPIQVTRKELSPAALEIARKYDALDDHGRKVIESITELEFQRLSTPSYASEVERFNRMAEIDATESSSSRRLG